MTNTLLAYHGKPEIKAQVLEELQAHYNADNFVKGHYWEDGKGCAVGCLIKSGNHIEYEERFGIPIHLARLEDCIFEGLPNKQAKEWPVNFMSSFEVGKDYSNVVWDFLRWLLLDYLLPKIKGEGKVYDDVRDVLRGAANVLGKGDARAVDAAARAAADAARAVDAARAAADAARAVDADRAAADAARAVDADRAAADAARAVDAAARAAAYAARAAAYAARAVDAAARAVDAYDAAYEKFAEKLIEIIKKT